MQYAQRGFPPLHGSVYRTALRLSGRATGGTGGENSASRSSGGGSSGDGVEVLLVWTPYERVLYKLWHVGVRVTALPAAAGAGAATGGGAVRRRPCGAASQYRPCGAASQYLVRGGGGGAEIHSACEAVVWCELPGYAGSDGAMASGVHQSIDEAAFTLRLPNSRRSLAEVSAARETLRQSCE